MWNNVCIIYALDNNVYEDNVNKTMTIALNYWLVVFIQKRVHKKIMYQ